MINPFVLYAGLGALVVGVAAGWSVRDWKADADALRAVEAANKAQKEAIAAISRPSEKLETVIAEMKPLEIQTRNTIREVYRNVEVPSDCAVPAAGVRLLDDARLNANAAASGEPIAAVRSAAPSAGAVDRPGKDPVGS